MKKKGRTTRRDRAKKRQFPTAAPQTNRLHIDQLAVDHPQSATAVAKGGEFVPYDENLLDRARTQWQFGDWKSLASLDRAALQHHPDRAKLALLAAAGHLQTNNTGTAREFLRLAQDWGCSKKLIGQILIAGVHNSLGRAATLADQQPRALKHFESAIAIGTPGCDLRLIAQARIYEQHNQLGLPPAQPTGQLDAPHRTDAPSTSTATIKSTRYASGTPLHNTPPPPRRTHLP